MTASRVTLSFLMAFLLFSTPAAAQLSRAAPVGGHAPIAAPSGEAADAAPLAAPPGFSEAALANAAETIRTFTPFGLFQRADIVVKIVLTLLLLASLWSWAIILDKWIAFARLKRKARRFEQNFWSGRPVDELYLHYSQRADHPMASVFVAGLREWKRNFEQGASPRPELLAPARERVEKAMNIAIARASEDIESGLSFLATVGSTAPFLGLFGTVWGIMTAFQAISQRQDTTLAAVAPGIAEALFATALGLVAAIPAVVFYNRFAHELGRYQMRLDIFADEFSAFLSRQTDERVK